MFETLYEDDLVSVESDERIRVLLVTRTSVRPPDAASLSSSYMKALRGCYPEDGPSWGLVLDMRAAPGNTADDYERAMSELRAQAQHLFRQVVTVIGTAAGSLQVQRLARSEEIGGRVCSNLDEAIGIATAAAS